MTLMPLRQPLVRAAAWIAALIRDRRRRTQPRRATIRSQAEMMSVLDERSRKFLGISGAEFIRRLELGELEQTPAVVHLTVLAGRPSSQG